MTKQLDTIGIIGVGLMGHGIATNIKAHGYSLVFLDHPGNQQVDDLVGAGATKAASPKAVAQQSDVVVLCVTGTPQVEAVMYGDAGVLAGLRPGATVVDCSTAMPSSTERIAAAVRKAAGHFLDAAMTRTPHEAAQGRLNLIIGGERADFERCKPLLASFAENMTYTGPAGTGHRMKLIHNFVSLGFAAVLTEAAACAEHAGVAPETLLEILASGGGGGVVLERFRPYIQARDESSFRFSLANALKDLSYYTAMADEAGMPHRTADAVRAAYQQGHEARPEGTVPELIEVWLAARRST
ncbi:MAG: NAD(P)-dependent oxidoreductase [Rhodanobacteraceae bacterium]